MLLRCVADTLKLTMRSPGGRRTCPALTVLLLLALASAAVRAQPAGPAKSLLWKVSSREGMVYLVGSVHLLTKDYYPLNPALDAAFSDSDLLVEELDLGEMQSATSRTSLLARSQLPPGQSLDQVVSATTFGLVTKRFSALGLPVDIVRQFKPWSLALMLLQLEWAKAGFDPELGLDRHFYDRARKEGKALRALETVEFQLSRFDGLSMDQQDRLLAQTIKDIETETANVTKLVDAWKAGDVATLERLSLQEIRQDRMLYQRFLVERNLNWMPVIESLFARRGRAFIVVGAAHLIGPDGLVQMLKAKGYSVEQL
jgi:uncharacterized protein YbaP (TraB family)